MVTKELVMKDFTRMDASPAAMLVQVASRYISKIYIQSEDGTIRVNAKSIMGMMSLGLDTGEKVTAIVEGSDEDAALEGIEKYLSGK